RPQPERQLGRRVVPGTREREHAPPLPDGDLADDVRRGAEAVQPEPRAVARERQRAVTDQARTQQRRRLQVGVAVRNGEAEALVRHHPLRIATVDRVAGKAGAQAEVLAPARAEAALAARPAEPRDADALANVEAAFSARHRAHY